MGIDIVANVNQRRIRPWLDMGMFKGFIKSKYMLVFWLGFYPFWILMMKDGLERFGYTLLDFWWFIIFVPIGCFIGLYLIIEMAEGLANAGSQFKAKVSSLK